MIFLFLLLGTSVLAQDEHFIDVRQIVKGAIDAMSRLPDAVQASQQQSDPVNKNATATQADVKKDDLSSLFKLPADIMKNLAARAGYIEPPQTSTYGPWIVTRRRSDEEDDEENGNNNSDEWVEVTEKKKKRRHKKKKTPEEEGLIKVSDLLPKVPQGGVPVAPTGLPQMPQSDSMAAPPGTQGIQAQSHLSQLPQSPNYIYKTVVVNGETYYVPIPITQALPNQPQQVPVTPVAQPVLPQFGAPSLMNPLLPQLPQPLMQQQQQAQVQTPQSSSYGASQQQTQQSLPAQPKPAQQFDPATFPPPVNPFLGRSRAQLVSSEAGGSGQVYPPRFVRPQLRNPMAASNAQDEPKAKILTPTTTEAPTTTPAVEPEVEEEDSVVVVHEEFAEPKANGRKKKLEVPLHIRTISERRSEDLRNADDREKLQEEADEPTATEAPKKKKKKSKKLKKSKKMEKKVQEVMEDEMESTTSSSAQNDVEIEMSATTLNPAPMAKPVSERFAKELESVPSDSQETDEDIMEKKRILKLKAEIAEGKFGHHHRRIHASKTMMMPRRIKMRVPTSEQSESTQEDSLEKRATESEQIETMDTEEKQEPERKVKKTRKTKKSRKHRKHRKSQVEGELEATTEATTTTTEAPTTTEMEEEIMEEPTTAMPERRKKKRRMRQERIVVDGESEHSNEKTEEITEQPKISHKRKRTHKKSRKHVTTTTEQPSTTTEKPRLPLKAHCLNIRSFARQFGMIDVTEFATAHCEYIENYYPELPCETVEAYTEECERFYRM